MEHTFPGGTYQCSFESDNSRLRDYSNGILLVLLKCFINILLTKLWHRRAIPNAASQSGGPGWAGSSRGRTECFGLLWENLDWTKWVFLERKNYNLIRKNYISRKRVLLKFGNDNTPMPRASLKVYANSRPLLCRPEVPPQPLVDLRQDYAGQVGTVFRF